MTTTDTTPAPAARRHPECECQRRALHPTNHRFECPTFTRWLDESPHAEAAAEMRERLVTALRERTDIDEVEPLVAVIWPLIAPLVVNLRAQVDHLNTQLSAAEAAAAAGRAVDLAGRLREAEADRNRNRADHVRACEQIAEMHAAAVGAVRGPIRGVVEDIADLRERAERAEAQLAEAREQLAAATAEEAGK